MFVNPRCLVMVSGLISLLVSSLVVIAQDDTALQQAQFNAQGQLVKPVNLDEWIHLGSNMGQGYNEGQFDAKSPGTFHIVEIEPKAYAYFKQHGRYADGTMLALSFYRAEEKNSPRLNGFSQGELVSFEIHLIDSNKFKDGRAFYNFGLNASADKIADGNSCVTCHREEGAFAGTFTQFYPKMQDILQELR